MTFLPVVERELRVASRRPQTHWARFSAALGALALGYWIWGWLAAGQPPHAQGYTLFLVLAGLAFVYSLLAGISVTADSLSEEKRQGTLGLLFLTDLRGFDVALGKLAATSLNVVYRLISVLPILAVPLLVGALTLAEFCRAALVLLNTLFFSLSAGMAVSAVSRRERRAMAGTFLLILAVTAGPALVGWVVSFKTQAAAYNHAWLLSSAVYPGVLALETSYQTKPVHFWTGLALTHLLGWVFLIAASLSVRNVWQDRPATGGLPRWRQRWRAWQQGCGPDRAAWRRRLLDLNPVSWLAGRDRLRPAYVFAFLLGAGLLWLWLHRKIGSAMHDPAVFVFTAYVLHLVIKVWVAAEACRSLPEDRRSGALELILSTPLSVDEILEGHIRALERQFAWPVAVILLADLAMLSAGMSGQSMAPSNDWLLLWIVLVVSFVVDLYTVAWLGLWLSLTSKRSSRAASGTVTRVLILPWAALLLCLTALASIRWQGEVGEFGILILAFAISLLNAALFFTWARANLRARFRIEATQPFGSDRKPETVPSLSALLPPPVSTPSESASLLPGPRDVAHR